MVRENKEGERVVKRGERVCGGVSEEGVVMMEGVKVGVGVVHTGKEGMVVVDGNEKGISVMEGAEEGVVCWK